MELKKPQKRARFCGFCLRTEELSFMSPAYRIRELFAILNTDCKCLLVHLYNLFAL